MAGLDIKQTKSIMDQNVRVLTVFGEKRWEDKN